MGEIVSSVDNTIRFDITREQQEALCTHFNKDITKMEEYEICELLNELLDTLR